MSRGIPFRPKKPPLQTCFLHYSFAAVFVLLFIFPSLRFYGGFVNKYLPTTTVKIPNPTQVDARGISRFVFSPFSFISWSCKFQHVYCWISWKIHKVLEMEFNIKQWTLFFIQYILNSILHSNKFNSNISEEESFWCLYSQRQLSRTWFSPKRDFRAHK